VAIEQLSGNLRDYTTLHVGGGAKQILRVSTDQELIDLVRDFDQAGEPLLILGGEVTLCAQTLIFRAR